MATTEIHAISSTPHLALNYCLSDKIEEIKSKDDINKNIPHRIFEENERLYVRYRTLTSFCNCNQSNPYSSFEDKQRKWQNTKYMNNGIKAKNGKEPLMYHLIQSFNGFEVPYEVANEIGRKLAEEVFKGFTVTVSTHGNTENLHNHFNISAWDENGKKWNKCNTTYRQIRKVSDRLCDEYGLSVLEHTREMNLTRFKDENGKLHYYEPTDRKNELIRKRKAGEISTDDVRSFRNTSSYKISENKKADNRSVIKTDIDVILPSCRSYEELISRLRELGYIVKDKKKNGDWLAHVSFQAPTQSKATREDKLGDGVFYLRENLEKHIAQQAKEIQHDGDRNHGDNEKPKGIPFIAKYEYGKTDLSQIDDYYKTIFHDGGYTTVERTDAEKKVISDIRIKDREVRGLIDVSHLHKIIAEQNARKREGKAPLSETREQKLVAQIQSSFRCLQYSEQHNIYSYKQIIDLYSASKGKYDAVIDNFAKAENAIAQFKTVLGIPNKLSDLLRKIDSKKDELEYVMEEYSADKRTVENYRALMSKFKIDTPQGRAVLEQKVTEFEEKQNVNRGYMADIIARMSELENCIRTFDRIDTERGNKNEVAMRIFDSISKPQDNPTGDGQRNKTAREGYEVR